MVIRQEQITAFAVALREEFCRKLAVFLRLNLSAHVEALSEVDLAAKINQHVERAAEFGFECQSDLARFVCLSFLPGRVFYEVPKVRAFLLMPARSPAKRLSY